MGWTRLMLRDEVYRGVGQAAAGNDLLPEAVVLRALATGERDFARRTRCRRRSAYMGMGGNIPVYTIPPDFCSVMQVFWRGDEAPLPEYTIAELASARPDWFSQRVNLGEKPRGWVRWTPNQIFLYATPLGVQTGDYLRIEGYVAPYAVGGSIATLARGNNVVTVTTTERHDLGYLSEALLLTGMADPSFSGLTPDFWEVGPQILSPTSFSFPQTGADATTTGGGIRFSRDGVLPMLTDDATPPFPTDYQLAPAYYAVLWIAARLLADDPVAQQAAVTAKALYEGLVAQWKAEQVM
ncbi:MAG: phage adaptor protein [Armatimonadota bacterium]